MSRRNKRFTIGELVVREYPNQADIESAKKLVDDATVATFANAFSFGDVKITCVPLWQIYFACPIAPGMDFYRASERKTQELLEKWDYIQITPLKLGYLKDKQRFVLIDGKAEFEAAEARGEKTMPCIIRELENIEEAALLFSKQGDIRRNPNAADSFKARVIAKDELAMTAKKICAAHDFILPDEGMARMQMTGRGIMCIDLIMHIVSDADGADILDATLSLIQSLRWDILKRGTSRPILYALSELIKDSGLNWQDTLALKLVSVCQEREISPLYCIERAREQYPEINRQEGVKRVIKEMLDMPLAAAG